MDSGEWNKRRITCCFKAPTKKKRWKKNWNNNSLWIGCGICISVISFQKISSIKLAKWKKIAWYHAAANQFTVQCSPFHCIHHKRFLREKNKIIFKDYGLRSLCALRSVMICFFSFSDLLDLIFFFSLLFSFLPFLSVLVLRFKMIWIFGACYELRLLLPLLLYHFYATCYIFSKIITATTTKIHKNSKRKQMVWISLASVLFVWRFLISRNAGTYIQHIRPFFSSTPLLFWLFFFCFFISHLGWS